MEKVVEKIIEKRVEVPVTVTKMLPMSMCIRNPNATLTEAMHQIEREILQQALIETGWNRTKSARNLGICYRSLLFKVQEHHLGCKPGKTVRQLSRQALKVLLEQNGTDSGFGVRLSV